MVFAIGAGTIRANPRHNFSKQKYQITTTKSIPINRDNLPVNLPEVGCGYSNGRAGCLGHCCVVGGGDYFWVRMPSSATVIKSRCSISRVDSKRK